MLDPPMSGSSTASSSSRSSCGASARTCARSARKPSSPRWSINDSSHSSSSGRVSVRATRPRRPRESAAFSSSARGTELMCRPAGNGRSPSVAAGPNRGRRTRPGSRTSPGRSWTRKSEPSSAGRPIRADRSAITALGYNAATASQTASQPAQFAACERVRDSTPRGGGRWEDLREFEQDGHDSRYWAEDEGSPYKNSSFGTLAGQLLDFYLDRFQRQLTDFFHGLVGDETIQRTFKGLSGLSPDILDSYEKRSAVLQDHPNGPPRDESEQTARLPCDPRRSRRRRPQGRPLSVPSTRGSSLHRQTSSPAPPSPFEWAVLGSNQ